jgi:hypothetical protein
MTSNELRAAAEQCVRGDSLPDALYVALAQHYLSTVHADDELSPAELAAIQAYDKSKADGSLVTYSSGEIEKELKMIPSVHADDDEPVDGEWLKSLSWHEAWLSDDEYYSEETEDQEDANCYYKSIGGEGLLIQWDEKHGMYMTFEGEENTVNEMPHIKTRGQLRKLLDALGVDGKPTPTA